MKLSDRIKAQPPCHLCKSNGGDWAVDGEGNPIPGRRCGCRRGFLLAVGDAGREKRKFTVPPYTGSEFRRAKEEGHGFSL